MRRRLYRNGLVCSLQRRLQSTKSVKTHPLLLMAVCHVNSRMVPPHLGSEGHWPTAGQIRGSRAFWQVLKFVAVRAMWRQLSSHLRRKSPTVATAIAIRVTQISSAVTVPPAATGQTPAELPELPPRTTNTRTFSRHPRPLQIFPRLSISHTFRARERVRKSSIHPRISSAKLTSGIR